MAPLGQDDVTKLVMLASCVGYHVVCETGVVARTITLDLEVRGAVHKQLCLPFSITGLLKC